MRKLLLIILAAITVSIAIYLGIGSDSYVLLRIGDLAMQVTLFIAVLIVLCLVVTVWACWSVFRGIILGAWPKVWRKRREQNLIRVAIENLALCNWRAARKELVRLANKTEKPVPLIVLSAQAAEADGDLEQAKNTYLQVQEEFPDWAYVVRVRLCAIALQQGDLEPAKSLLSELKNERKGDTQLQVFEVRLAEELRDWSRLQKALLAALKKPGVQAQVAATERRYLQARLAEKPGSPELLELLEYLSATDTAPAQAIAQLAQQLSMRGHSKEAELLIRKSINRRWDESLVSVYADVEAKSPAKQLKNAESWLAAHSDSKVLVESLEKLAARAGDESKAESYALMLKKNSVLESAAVEKLPASVV